MQNLTKEMRTMIEEQFPFLATVDKDGYPKIGPKGSLHVLDSQHLIYYEHTFRHAYSNISANGRVAVAVADRQAQKGFRFEGLAHLHEDDEITERFLPKQILERFNRGAVVIIDIHSVYKLDNTLEAGTRII
ncbi:pyridoxamine 5'-phosphate oxidase family protein [Leuconostoc falkenbergense]|uniref:pyridoxamine 5'-phosphate oxidase family protein n=1 Tax=Leuconostoc falkenbergense TaxID=2766470 RepID=UPI0024ACDB90|nr:pyridoxamine 5'-phosphate oxidase family protein [Leuconostoc falkenbergense]MDI6666713.1 pyridoxamine 5'-phosphate oxidase family protein [Leuconostoc falkenbergense]